MSEGFTQDDAHIFCLPEQLEDEIVQVLDLTEKILTRFGFNKYDIMLSTRPEKVGGWRRNLGGLATTALKGALTKKGWEYDVDEGGGAFYGPKIDLKIRDAIGRQWQCSTVQCDFNLPERFGLEYVSAEGSRERPIMVHRAIFGSLERSSVFWLKTALATFLCGWLLLNSSCCRLPTPSSTTVIKSPTRPKSWESEWKSIAARNAWRNRFVMLSNNVSQSWPLSV